MLLAIDQHQRVVGDREVLDITPRQPSRIVLYSHDTVGMGHLRRNLLVAQCLSEAYPRASILLIAGAMEISAFTAPPRVDCLALPGLRKQEDGCYGARRLGVELSDLIALRSHVIYSAIEAFAPDALIVDNVPRGAVGELDVTLQALRHYSQTCCILGLRDVLDEPAAVEREWRRSANEAAIRAYYDAVWIYGDRRVYDPVAEYRFSSDVAAKASFVGYQDRCGRLSSPGCEAAETLAALAGRGERLMLCLVGGGEDGAHLTEAFAEAEFPEGSTGVIVAGPFMPAPARRRLRELAAARTGLMTIDFTADPESLIAFADRVVAMGGYNTLCELLCYEKQALVVPRVAPRSEQMIRARRLEALGLVDVLHPDDLCPAALTRWLASPPAIAPRVRHVIDLDASLRLPGLLELALAARRSTVVPALEVAACASHTY